MPCNEFNRSINKIKEIRYEIMSSNYSANGGHRDELIRFFDWVSSVMFGNGSISKSEVAEKCFNIITRTPQLQNKFEAIQEELEDIIDNYSRCSASDDSDSDDEGCGNGGYDTDSGETIGHCSGHLSICPYQRDDEGCGNGGYDTDSGETIGHCSPCPYEHDERISESHCTTSPYVFGETDEPSIDLRSSSVIQVQSEEEVKNEKSE